MGNAQLDNSVSRQKLQYSLENDLIFLKKITDDRYGEIKVMQIKDSKPRELVALKTIMASSVRDCSQIYDQVALRKGMDLDTVVRIKVMDKTEMDQYCSHYYKIYVLYEYYEKTLKSEIEKREGKKFPNVHFQEKEIYRLIDCVLSALILFFKNNIVHSDIRPHTIFYSDEGIFKLNDIQFMSGLNAYTQFLMGTPDYDNCFLAPELFEQLGHRILQPVSQNYQKTDVFSLGMTALEAATLRPIHHCYDFDAFIVKEEIIQEYLEEVKMRYSDDLYNLLKNMVQLNENQRFDYTMVYESLSRRQEQISPEKKSVYNREEKPKEKTPKHIIQIIDPQPPTSIRENYQDLNLLEEKIKVALMRSEDAQKRVLGPEAQKMKNDLSKDDYYEFVAKREEVVRKSAQARESITMERKKKTAGMIDERELLDSKKLYEMYLEEYENLRNKEFS